MDLEEFTQMYNAITPKMSEEGKISFKSEMKSKGQKIVVGCLEGKVLTIRSVNKDGLKLALQQAW